MSLSAHEQIQDKVRQILTTAEATVARQEKLYDLVVQTVSTAIHRYQLQIDELLPAPATPVDHQRVTESLTELLQWIRSEIDRANHELMAVALEVDGLYGALSEGSEGAPSQLPEKMAQLRAPEEAPAEREASAVTTQTLGAVPESVSVVSFSPGDVSPTDPQQFLRGMHAPDEYGPQIITISTAEVPQAEVQPRPVAEPAVSAPAVSAPAVAAPAVSEPQVQVTVTPEALQQQIAECNTLLQRLQGLSKG